MHKGSKKHGGKQKRLHDDEFSSSSSDDESSSSDGISDEESGLDDGILSSGHEYEIREDGKKYLKTWEYEGEGERYT